MIVAIDWTEGGRAFQRLRAMYRGECFMIIFLARGNGTERRFRSVKPVADLAGSQAGNASLR